MTRPSGHVGLEGIFRLAATAIAFARASYPEHFTRSDLLDAVRRRLTSGAADSLCNVQTGEST